MKVQAISNKTFITKNEIPQTEQTNSEIKTTNFNSIYSKGMSGLTFGAVVPVKTSFAKEIAEQPKVLKNIIDKFTKAPGKISGIDINLTKKEIQRATAINIVASGSSKNSGEMAKSFMEEVTGLPVNIISASEFITTKPKLNQNDLMVFISQSGNTADTLNALEYSKDLGLKTIAVTNDSKSKIHKAADFALNMEAGIENAVAATKTVTSSVVNLWGIGMKLGEIKGSFSPKSDAGKEYISALKKLPAQIEQMLQNKFVINKVANENAHKENFYFLAKEPNLGAVNEGALKLTETTHKRVIAGSSGEFMHGLFTSIQPNDVLVEVATGNGAGLAVDNFLEIIKKRNVKNAVLMKNEKIETLSAQGLDFINIPDTKSEFMPIFTTIRFQQLTEAITKKLGINPDNGGGVLTKFRQNLSM